MNRAFKYVMTINNINHLCRLAITTIGVEQKVVYWKHVCNDNFL